MADMKEQLSAINKMSKKSVALYHKIAASIGVSDSALGVLYALMNTDEPCSQYDLCSDWFIPKQTINSTVSALQKKGFVCLIPVQGNRNKKKIELTKSGRKFVKNTIGKLYDAELSALSELTCEERELFISLNRKYNQFLTQKIDVLLTDMTYEQRR